uniref:NACHT LRR and PYD domain-containing protein n=1 Tax=Poecilia mexicana TaxID=48701 RepID=A0A3B3WCD8_9TELE
MDRNTLVEGKEPDLNVLYQSAVEKALDSPNGHLDLFLRFLLGLSLQTNQSLLKGLLKWTTNNSQRNQHTDQCIKKYTEKSLCFEKMLCLFHCLNETKYSSVVEEIQRYLTSGRLRTHDLSPAEWSDLVSIILSSESNLDVFELKNYGDSENVLLILSSLFCSRPCSLRELDLSSNSLQDAGVKQLCAGLQSSHCKLETLSLCDLSDRSCQSVCSILSSHTSLLRVLDLSNNDLQDSGVQLLCEGLESPNCKLESLSLSGCMITEEGCASLALTLSSKPSALKQLDLSYNHPGESGLKLLSAGLDDPNWGLETLRLSVCNLSPSTCATLSTVLSSQSSHLRELDLSNNDLTDTGVTLLCGGLRSAQCTLTTLRLSGCLITGEGCASLASALRSNPCHLKELDLSYNHPGEEGVNKLTALDSFWKPEKLRYGKVNCSNTDSWLRRESNLVYLINFYDCHFRLGDCNLSERSYEALASVLCSESSNLRQMDLSNNNLQDSGAEQLLLGLKSPYCKLEILRCHLHWTSLVFPENQVTDENR